MDENSRISIIGITIGFVVCIILISLTSCEREKMLLQTIQNQQVKTTHEEIKGK